jgi:hypothetical protein
MPSIEQGQQFWQVNQLISVVVGLWFLNSING